MSTPAASRYVVAGAGIHGLSTAYHLAKELRARGSGSGADVVVLEKSEPGAGASGIACGVVRNNYFQPAMSELMQACVEVWESDPAAYHYNPVGYVALGAAVQEDDLIATYERQERIGYRSELIVGAAQVDAHMKELFPDWRARGVTRALVSGGGDMVAGDAPPGKKGWRIEVAPLDVTNAPPARFVLLANAGLATSGDLFQHLEIDGKRYSHIIDPHTGIGLTDHSLVTVIAPDGITADGLSTAISVLGPEAGTRLVEKTRGAAVHVVRMPGDRIEMTESSRFKRFYEAP